MTTSIAPARVPLLRPRVRLITGVSAALAAHLRWNVWVVRALFLLLTPFGGAGIVLYVWLWIFVPTSQTPADVITTRSVPVAWMAVGTSAVTSFFAATGLVSAGPYGSSVASPLWWLFWLALALISGVFAAVWAGLLDYTDPERGPKHVVVVRSIVTALFVILFALMAYDFSIRGGGALSFFTSLLMLVAIGLVHAPGLVRTMRDASKERIRRIKEEQRSEMAAHLHDSVLQTLALIQNRAGASSEAARLARAQERELRSWLYDGDEPADSDLPTDLRDYAAALELDYPVVIDVVAAGESTERASGEVAAAAREAILNAARHAPGAISVYIEGSARAVDVFVRDHGSGFDLESIPSDRLGVRQSIIGRMRRAGGDAKVIRRANGTEIHLTLDYARATSQSRQQETS